MKKDIPYRILYNCKAVVAWIIPHHCVSMLLVIKKSWFRLMWALNLLVKRSAEIPHVRHPRGLSSGGESAQLGKPSVVLISCSSGNDVMCHRGCAASRTKSLLRLIVFNHHGLYVYLAFGLQFSKRYQLVINNRLSMANGEQYSVSIVHRWPLIIRTKSIHWFRLLNWTDVGSMSNQRWNDRYSC